MKTAFIPPTPELPKYGQGDFHLLLSHLMGDNAYVGHYYNLRRRGAYLVLDNSAHEHREGEKARILAKQAAMLDAQEVVVPDCLEEGEKTVQLAVDALEYWYESRFTTMARLNPALMYVPQGKDREEWCDCFHALCNLHIYMARRKDFRRDFVIGISKDYEPWEGGLLGLIYDYVAPMRQLLHAGGIKMHVHMLGWPRNLWSLNNMAQMFPWVRSTDSAKPFVYALAGKKLNPSKQPPPYPTRPATYFNRKFNDKEDKLALHNCMIFEAAARGQLTEMAHA